MQPHSDFSDQELLALLKSDDNAAFTEIYNRYWKTLYALSYNRLRVIQVAEDIVHDVYVSLWNNRKQTEINNLQAYLATSVKYGILSHFRKSQTLSNIVDLPDNSLKAVTFDLLDSIHNRRILKLLNEEVEKLPAKCRLIYKYSREEHKSTKQIAEELQISTSTVENQLNKALNRLRVVFKKFNSLLFTIL